MSSKLLIVAMVLAGGCGLSVAQSAPADVPAVAAPTSLRPAEAPLAGLARVDKNTLALALVKQKLLLYDFEFNGDTVTTDKLHLRQISSGVFEITSIAYTAGEWRVRIRDAANYYGLGERGDTLNHARTVLHNLSQSSPGARGSSTSKPIPFFMSTTGYGIWFDVSGDATFDLNASSEADILVDADAEKLRILLFTGPEFPRILDAFTAQAGRSLLPPYWAFAPWLGGELKDNARLQETIDKARTVGLPASVLVGVQTEGFGPDAIKHLHASGFKVLAEASPSVKATSPEYAEAAASGFFVKAVGGAAYADRSGGGTASFVDFTNARAKLWWQGRLRQAIAGGVDGFETGDAPVFPGEVKFNDESDERVMRNRYAVLENKAVEEVVEKDMKGAGALLMRSTSTGANGGLVYDAGGHASFSPEDGIATAVTAGLNAGLSGMPLWASGPGDLEAGGAANAQMLMRWAEFAAFTPVMATTSNVPPWGWGDAALAVYRKFSTLHMSLFPYRYAAAQEGAKTGMPMMRALVLQYQDDVAARQARNEYLFGPDLLVAPIADEGTQRAVYLPPGEWLDYWTGEAVVGGRVVVADAAVDSMPLYVRREAILPKIPDDVMTLVPAAEIGDKTLKALDERRVYEMYGSATTLTSITDFEGRTLVRSGDSLTIAGDAAAHVILRWRFQKIASVTVDGVAARVETDALGQFVTFEYKKQATIAWR